MSPSLLSYIWKYSARQQIILLILTVISFPILYLSLELPKQIINEAIGSSAFPVEYFGFSLGQFEYMGVLCGAFLLTVIVSGVLKMRTNIFKGTVSERLLRRFRYQLISRILRFPLPHFRRTSQGALISMVTAETEPMGSMMGDAVSRPVFAAGQMLTVAAFLFVQNVWLGVAAIVMIPLQAYIIPKLQRHINQLNKKRILVVRSLSDRIGESVTGVEELRNNNGLGHALADFSKRLGRIFYIRLEIYNRKFFMKFLNNFMNQLTPFLFLSIGGYLVVKGQLTVGALAAALASHKDLMSPWRELLAYYSQIQDVSLRYVTITEQFTPPDMIDEELFYGHPAGHPDLKGPISMKNVTIMDQYGIPILDHINLDIKQGSLIAIQSDNSFARRAFVQALTRSVVTATGNITIAGKDLSKLHQETIAARIATAGGGSHIFSGTVGENLQMPLMPAPVELDHLSDQTIAEIEESRRVGNSADPIDTDWLNPELAGVASRTELRNWWLEIIRAVGLDDLLMNRGLEAKISQQDYPELTTKLIKLRKRLHDKFRSPEFAKYVYFFDRSRFNPGLTVSENMLFSIRNDDAVDTQIIENPAFLQTLQELDLQEDLRQLAIELMTMLVQVFSSVGAEHPMFQRTASLSPDFFENLVKIYRKQSKDGWLSLSDEERMAVTTLPFTITAEQFADVFPETLKQKILQVRRDFSYQLYNRARDFYAPLDRNSYCPNLSVLENILFGRVSRIVGGVPIGLLRIIGTALDKEDLRGDIMTLNIHAEAGISGANMPQIAREHIDFIRAAIRRPDVLILDHIFSGNEEIKRSEMKRNARALLPGATIIVLESRFRNPQQYDAFYELRNGRLIEAGSPPEQPDDVDTGKSPGSANLVEKLHVLSRTALFAGLDRRQLRLLAHGSHWVSFKKGDYIFRAGDPTDGAYTFTAGSAELWLPESNDHRAIRITTIEPGRIIGDLSVILEQDREFDLQALSDIKGLCISKQAFLDVLEHDNEVALSLLKTVSGHLLHSRELW
ncbi:ABC transporter transmembrane domain-containing protein [Hoeflea sp. TYP-13]|uniref:ABC transporter transmembrane domain-containing protein n=1 Tax=Hoeflea sp. TYP-13 TaxID=3230023 RepID=UPI0034C5B4C0